MQVDSNFQKGWNWTSQNPRYTYGLVIWLKSQPVWGWFFATDVFLLTFHNPSLEFAKWLNTPLINSSFCLIQKKKKKWNCWNMGVVFFLTKVTNVHSWNYENNIDLVAGAIRCGPGFHQNEKQMCSSDIHHRRFCIFWKILSIGSLVIEKKFSRQIPTLSTLLYRFYLFFEVWRRKI